MHYSKITYKTQFQSLTLGFHITQHASLEFLIHSFISSYNIKILTCKGWNHTKFLPKHHTLRIYKKLNSKKTSKLQKPNHSLRLSLSSLPRVMNKCFLAKMRCKTSPKTQQDHHIGTSKMVTLNPQGSKPHFGSKSTCITSF